MLPRSPAAFSWRGLVPALALVACAPPPAVVTPEPARPAAVTDGGGVLGAMRAKYGGQWFTTLTFAQNTTTFSATGREIRGVWNEYLEVPGRLRIDYLPLSSHGGVLYRDGMSYAFADGKQQSARTGWNPLQTLIADVYVQPVDSSAKQLAATGFDLAVLTEGTWNGRPAWIVGAGTGDTTTSQFWIDRDSMLVRRVIQREIRAGRPFVTDIRLADFRSVGGFPIAFNIQFFREGRLYFREEYFNVRVNVPIPPAVFDPAQWVASQIIP